MDKRAAEDGTQISCKLVTFIFLPGNPLKLYNAMMKNGDKRGKTGAGKKDQS